MNYSRQEYLQRPLPVQEQLLQLFQVHEELTLFEIGACEGLDSVKYSRLFPRARLFVFEPLPANVQRIKDILAHEKRENRAKVFAMALSNASGTAEFHVSALNPNSTKMSDNWDFGNKSSSLLAPDKHLEQCDFIEFKDTITVPTKTLAQICEENCIDGIDYVHLDVQGAELMVLAGAGDYLDRIKALWLEVSKVELYAGQPLKKDVEKYLRARGFKCFYEDMGRRQGDQFYLNLRYFKIHAFSRKIARLF